MECKAGLVEKLISNLSARTKYVFHHRTLQEYVCMDVKVSKFNYVIDFNVKAWLKYYTELTTRMHQRVVAARDKARMSTFKVNNNAIFIKYCEILPKRVILFLNKKNRKT